MPGFNEWKAEGTGWEESPELWEHQGQRLTVGELVQILAEVDPALPLRFTVYDGTAGHRLLEPVELGYVGEKDRPDALLLIVTDLGG
jgi:hypothetical protein